jgi:hypothetical protein
VLGEIDLTRRDNVASEYYLVILLHQEDIPSVQELPSESRQSSFAVVSEVASVATGAFGDDTAALGCWQHVVQPEAAAVAEPGDAAVSEVGREVCVDNEVDSVDGVDFVQYTPAESLDGMDG